MKQDKRKAGGLNNQKLPLRKVIQTFRRDDLKRFYGDAPIEHELDCGHVLPAASSSYVRHRRCYRCGAQEAGA